MYKQKSTYTHHIFISLPDDKISFSYLENIIKLCHVMCKHPVHFCISLYIYSTINEWPVLGTDFAAPRPRIHLTITCFRHFTHFSQSPKSLWIFYRWEKI